MSPYILVHSPVFVCILQARTDPAVPAVRLHSNYIHCAEHFVVSRFARWPPALANIVAIAGHVRNLRPKRSRTPRVEG